MLPVIAASQRISNSTPLLRLSFFKHSKPQRPRSLAARPDTTGCWCRAIMKLDLPDPQYRLNTGICLYKNGLVWVGRRLHTANSGPRWQMPQGGIDEGEEPAAAARRELEEETGVTSAAIVAETDGWLHYTFPDGANRNLPRSLRKYKGQAQKWFLMKFEGSEEEICLTHNHPEFSAFAWWPFHEVIRQVVPFKAAVYEAVRAHFEPIILKDI